MCALPITSVMISCKPLEYICIYKRSRQISPHRFCLLSFTVCHFPFDGMNRGAQAEKYKRTHTDIPIYIQTHILSVCMQARSIRVQFSYTQRGRERERGRVSESIGDGENPLATNASPIPSEKSLNQMYLACFPFIRVFFSIHCAICLAVCNGNSRLNL